MIALADTSEHPKKAAFLAAYEQCGIVSAACRASQVGRTTHYEWLADDEDYRAKFHEAHASAVEAMEIEARRRAIEGWDEPVFYEGGECGVRRKYSDVLLIFMLKGAKPDVYAEHIQHGGQVGHEHRVTVDHRLIAKEMLNEPNYVEYLRHSEADSDPRLAGPNGHKRNGQSLYDGPPHEDN